MNAAIAVATGWCFRRRLRHSPYAGSLCPSELASLPDLPAHEYAQLAQLGGTKTEPVLLSWTQHYRLLAEFVRLARQQLGAAPLLLLVQHQAPNHVVPLPAELLAEDVLLTHDPAPLAQRLARIGGPTLVVLEDDLRRDSHEGGANEIAVSVYGAPGPEALLDLLRASPLRACIGEIGVNDLEALR